MTNDWVITLTFVNDIEDPSGFEDHLETLDASVAFIPSRGIDVTIYIDAALPILDAINSAASRIAAIFPAVPIGIEIVQETEWQRRADAPTMPELMSAVEIADELGVTRQRVHQLRATKAFPAPLAELKGGAVWDAAAIRHFNSQWERKPGRPGHGVANGRVLASDRTANRG